MVVIPVCTSPVIPSLSRPSASLDSVYLMASCGDSCVSFMGTCDNAFYFQEICRDLDEDSFKMSSQKPKIYWVQSKDNKFLLIKPGCQFEVNNLNNDQLQHSDCKFGIQPYLEKGQGRDGIPAMLYAVVGNKKVVVCCNQDFHIHPEVDLPRDIHDDACSALFYMKKIQGSGKYQFESAMCHNKYLGFEPDRNNSTLQKLVLKNVSEGEVDVNCILNLSQK
ncbi:uncharacterized protein LOC134880283 isoform X2 [Eleginops maclovinus]|uniref:uncharacterized protein LOC134880283 isoform X2 n=1 Tax=Eleginops maclovinus TaxID=56733 RepID=UPI00307FD483